MIITAFATTLSQRRRWQMELLEYSWRKAGQAGELLGLAACPQNQALPESYSVRMVRTMPWNPHPYTQDEYAPYNTAASVMEWLLTDCVDATVLLIEPESVFTSPVCAEVRPGQAQANLWSDLPVDGSGPFGLSQAFHGLRTYCSNPDLSLPAIQLPVLIHSSELKRIAPRWLELTGLIRSTIDENESRNAASLAYAIAAAEFRVAHEPAKLAASIDEDDGDAPIIDYRGHLEDEKGNSLWRCEDYQPWESPVSNEAATGSGRKFLSCLHDYVSAREIGHHLADLVPVRVEDVREALVVDQLLLDIPGNENGLSLNPSAASIWKLIDDRKSMIDISEALEKSHGLPQGSLWRDIEATASHLTSNGAIRIVTRAGNRS